MIEKEEGLKRYVGVLGLSANIINIIIGAGIFIIPAIVAENMRATSNVAYIFCGFLITLIMLCFAESGSKITDTGGYTVPILSSIIILYLLSNLKTAEKIGIAVFIAILTVIYAILIYYKKKNND